MSQLQSNEQKIEELQQMEGGQGSEQVEGVADQPNAESHELTSTNPSVVSEPPHLGGADPRTLSNVLESQIDRSESGSGSEVGSAASNRKRARAEQQPTRTSTRE